MDATYACFESIPFRESKTDIYPKGLRWMKVGKIAGSFMFCSYWKRSACYETP